MPEALRRRWLLWLWLLFAAGPALAQSVEPSADYSRRASQLVGLLNGAPTAGEIFSPAFLAKVPPEQLAAISTQIRAQLGAARAVSRIAAETPSSGTLFVDFDKGVLQLRMVIAPAAPSLVEGLLVLGSEVKGDSLDAVVGELKALPGRTSLAVARLGDGPPAFLVQHEAARPMAIGSAFKLFLLAEAARQVRASERKWSDVVPLSHRSFASGMLQSWPQGAPITLHSLAALMISISDNSAADTLLDALGREKVEALLPALGLTAPERNRPFLSTLETFALKTGPDTALRAEWLKGDEAARRVLLGRVGAIGADKVVLNRLAGVPADIDTLEWFASTTDLVRTMDWLRLNGGDEARAILAINPGIREAVARDFSYVGYKGGSEPGVMQMSLLLQTRAGAWYALSGSWNNPAAPVDEAKFAQLMSRAAALVK